jgi:predicted phosphoserine aminotransferase
MADHVRLFIPGPVEVRREILEAQTQWMIGHRSKDFENLYARLQPKLKQSFKTEKGRVLVYTSSGTGVWESASRCCIRDDQRVLHLTNGAFSERWLDVSRLNGKTADVIDVEWGQAVPPQMLADALKKQRYDAVACVYNETSTGVLNPIAEYAQILRDYPDTLFLVDSVSCYLGADIRFDEWGIDLCLTSSQKAMALPPGIAFGAISDRALERAKQVKNRGYYFDIIEMDKLHQKNNTPATPPIALMFAADKQLEDVLVKEGLENRFARHQKMSQMTRDWVAEHGFAMYSQDGYHSPTVSTVKNTRNIGISDLNKFLKARGMTISNGYGKAKDVTMRIAHMGDIMPEDMTELLTAMSEFLAQPVMGN